MATRLDESAEEEGTYIIDLSWYDETDSAVTPSTMLWALVDENGDTVNSRLDVSIGSLSTTNSIVLQGDDLAIPDHITKNVDRYVRYYGTYLSTFGTLSITGEVVFSVTNHRGKQ